jgi:hypothetical protein
MFRIIFVSGTESAKNGARNQNNMSFSGSGFPKNREAQEFLGNNVKERDPYFKTNGAWMLQVTKGMDQRTGYSATSYFIFQWDIIQRGPQNRFGRPHHNK